MKGPKWLLLLLLAISFQLNFAIDEQEDSDDDESSGRSVFGLQRNLIIDLSLPGVTVQSGIQSVLPGILNKIQNELKKRNSVTFAFMMTTPPYESPAYMGFAQNELLSSLKTLFPDCQISVTSTPLMNFWGYLTHITFEVSLKRGGGTEIFTGVTEFENVINLLQPNINVVAEYRAMIVGLLSKIRAGLKADKRVTFNIKVEVPINPSAGFLEDLQTNLIVQLTTYFPGYNLKLKYTTYNNVQTGSTDVIFTVKLGKKSDEIVPGLEDNIVLKVIPGQTTIGSELEKYIPSVASKLQQIYRGGKPTSFNFKIVISARYLVISDVYDEIMMVMAKYFPDARMRIKWTSAGPEEMLYQVDLLPNIDGDTSLFPLPYYEINLRKPGVDLTKELNELFNRILPKSPKDLKKRFTFNILLIPPQLVDIEYVDVTVSKITSMIRQKFPNCNVIINANIKENSWGGIMDIIFEVAIQRQSRSPGVETPAWKNILIDIKQPRDTLIAQIQKWIKSLTHTSKKLLKSGKPVGLHFEMKPGTDTRKPDLKKITSLIMSIIINVFPDHKIDTKAREVQGEKGYIKSSDFWITIHPARRNDGLELVTIPTPISIDLHTPGSSVDTIMSKLIPEIFGQTTITDSKYQVKFVINPPKGYDVKYVKDISQQIVEYFNKYFPEYYVEFYANGILDPNNNGEITQQIVLVPGKSTAEGGFLAGTSPKYFVYDVPKNYESLLIAIDNWLQSNIVEINSQLRNTPVAMEFRVTPPTKTTVEYEAKVLEQIREWMINLFHHSNIGLGITSMKDNKGYLTEMSILVTIEPIASDSDTIEPPLIITPPTTPKPTTTTVTPSPTTGTGTSSTESDTKTVPPQVPIIPVFNLTELPGVDLESKIRPGLNKLIIDISSILKTGKPSSIQYSIQFPKGTSKLDLKGMIEMIKGIYIQQFPNNNVKVTIGDIEGNGSIISSAMFAIVVEPVEYSVINFDLTNPPADVTEILEIKLPEIEKLLKNSMKKDNNKGGCVVNIMRPIKESPKFVLEIIQVLTELIESSFPDLDVNLDVDVSDSKNINIIIKLVQPLNRKPPENELEFMITVSGSEEKTLIQSVDAKIDSLYATLVHLVGDGKKTKLIMNMDLGSGSTENSVEKIIEHLRVLLKEKFPNVTIGITPFLKRDSNNNPYYAQLNVILEPNDVSSQPGKNVFKIVLTDSNLTMNAAVLRILPDVANVVRKYLTERTAVTINFVIIPPKKSVDSFLTTVAEVMIPSITSSFCNYENKWKINTNTDLEGFLIDVVLTMTFMQPANVEPSETTECRKDITIDLTPSGSQLEVEIDRILPSVYALISNNLEQGKIQILRFNCVIPSEKNIQEKLKEIVDSSQKVLQNYFPFNNKELRASTDRHGNGNYAMIQLTVTIQPDDFHIPPSSITIPLEVSLEGSLSYSLKMAVSKYSSLIQSLLAQKSSVVMVFQINPPRGAKEEYIRKIPEKIIDFFHELYPTHMISTESKGAKTSNGDYFKITVVVTLSRA